MEYVATFFSHYDAVLFTRKLSEMGIVGTMMPVPRRVSSSCGTGVRFVTDADVATLAREGVERIFRYEDNVYTQALDNSGV